ncbi:hypothetical protein GOP47_0001378 [Adiantum capillus-veneris]|uniref:Uncharacterized protein n=1 Tax=Adiantum capillus-veneris TaxID=13818 RepID=A0A9D4V8Y0_ADICA|nr:hypothetical protein GOP47_0001378 [Adiantum capillus-veneris]
MQEEQRASLWWAWAVTSHSRIWTSCATLVPTPCPLLANSKPSMSSFSTMSPLMLVVQLQSNQHLSRILYISRTISKRTSSICWRQYQAPYYIRATTAKFPRNQANVAGGVVYADDSSADCEDVGGAQLDYIACTFVNNTARQDGGALQLAFVSSGATASTKQSAFISNRAGEDGGDVNVQADQVGALGAKLNSFSTLYTTSSALDIGSVENVPPAPSPPPSSNIIGDPHFVGKHGQRFDIHGKDGKDCCVVSDHAIHINMHVFQGGVE